MPYKNMFNGHTVPFFLDSLDGHCGEDQYLLGFILPYLENFDSFRCSVPTFVEHNPFGRIKCIDQNNP